MGMKLHTRPAILGRLAFLLCACALTPGGGAVRAQTLAPAAGTWPFDQRQILLAGFEGSEFPDSLTAAQIMDVFVQKGRVRWVMQAGGKGQILPVLVPRDFPWHSTVAVRNLGLKHKVDGILALSSRGPQIDLRWYATADGQPLFLESFALPAAGAKIEDQTARKERVQATIGDLWARIPGVGYVVRRDLSTLSIEGASSMGIKVGDRLEIRRLSEVQRHPLLKTLVGIDSTVSGYATITQLDEPFSVAKIDYESNADPIREGDRYALTSVTVAKPESAAPLQAPAPEGTTPIESAEEDSGFFSFLPKNFLDLTAQLVYAKISHEDQTLAATSPLTMSGSAPGFDLAARVFITREWIVGGNALFTFAKYKSLSSNYGADSLSGKMNSQYFYGGYRFLFMEEADRTAEFDLLVGYRRYAFAMSELSSSVAPTSKAFAGLDFGFYGSIPFLTKFHAYLSGSRLLSSGLSETPVTGGATSAGSIWTFEAGVKYDLGTASQIVGGLGFVRASVDYEGTGTRLTPSTTTTINSTLITAGYKHKF